MTTTYTLQLVPSTHRVVPVEPTDEMIQYVQDDLYSAEWIYKDMLSKAPPIDTPPVLRWEGLFLKCANIVLCHVRSDGSKYGWSESLSKPVMDRRDTLQEARLAAEKALGFPDGLVIDESN